MKFKYKVGEVIVCNNEIRVVEERWRGVTIPSLHPVNYYKVFNSHRWEMSCAEHRLEKFGNGTCRMPFLKRIKKYFKINWEAF